MSMEPFVRTTTKFVHPAYYVWSGMVQRTSNPSCANFHRYGGRGIRMFEGWRHDPQAFFDHIGPRPSKHHTCDRIDNDGHYEPGNVRWATRKEQGNNTRRVRILNVGGEDATISEWAKRSGVPIATIHSRLRQGWSHDQAVLKPATGRRGRSKLSDAEIREVRDLARDGLSRRKIANRFGISHSSACRIVSGQVFGRQN